MKERATRESQGEGKYGGRITEKQRQNGENQKVCVCVKNQRQIERKTQFTASRTEQTHLQSGARLENNYLPSPLPLWKSSPFCGALCFSQGHIHYFR